jgi:hypothetical protein
MYPTPTVACRRGARRCVLHIGRWQSAACLAQNQNGYPAAWWGQGQQGWQKVRRTVTIEQGWVVTRRICVHGTQQAHMYKAGVGRRCVVCCLRGREWLPACNWPQIRHRPYCQCTCTAACHLRGHLRVQHRCCSAACCRPRKQSQQAGGRGGAA